MMELVYMTVLETVAARRVGSTPTTGTIFRKARIIGIAPPC